jgi:hypothetical protein
VLGELCDLGVQDHDRSSAVDAASSLLLTGGGSMADETDDMTVVPIPGEEDDAERRRIRRSNDRDQDAERHGKVAPHNAGYDQAADGVPPPDIERIVDADE